MWVYPNNWIPTKSLDEMANTEYDVLIVGSGAGGGAMLYRLCELWKNQGVVSTWERSWFPGICSAT